MASTVKDGRVKFIRLFKTSDLPIIRHIKVKGNACVYNPVDAEYFEQRRYQKWLRRKTDYRFLSTPAIERTV